MQRAMCVGQQQLQQQQQQEQVAAFAAVRDECVSRERKHKHRDVSFICNMILCCCLIKYNDYI